MKHNSMKIVDVIQLLGGVGDKTDDTDANAISLALANALNGDSYLPQAPFMVKSKILKEPLMDEPHINEHFEIIKHSKIALAGLGSAKPALNAHFRSGHITLEDTQKLMPEGAIGGIC